MVFKLEKLLLIVLAPVAIISGILYLSFSNSERRMNFSHYWKANKAKFLIYKNLHKEFKRHDQKVKAFKQLLEIVIAARNYTQKGLNELKILVQEISKNIQINADDLNILDKIGAEIISLTDNLRKIKTEVSNTLTKDFTRMTNILTKTLINYNSCIQNILNAPRSILGNPEFISHEIQIMEEKYTDIVEIHSQLIKEFQASISETDK